MTGTDLSKQEQVYLLLGQSQNAMVFELYLGCVALAGKDIPTQDCMKMLPNAQVMYWVTYILTNQISATGLYNLYGDSTKTTRLWM